MRGIYTPLSTIAHRARTAHVQASYTCEEFNLQSTVMMVPTVANENFEVPQSIVLRSGWISASQ